MLDLKGKKGLIIGIANQNSIAYGCGKALQSVGASLAVTYVNEKAEPHVKPLAEELEAELLLPCDYKVPGQLESVFKTIRQHWKTLDFVIHSIAYCPKEDLQGRLVDCSEDGFTSAMAISCYSFIKTARLAEEIMNPQGTLVTMTYYGAEKYIENYGVMGPIKAALEASVKYLAVELGKRKIRVHGVSPGPIATRAASGLKDFEALMKKTRQKTPEQELATVDDVGNVVAFLVSNKAAGMTGNITYVDKGVHVLGL
jgi:enoyl-[acyl-carrier protein] reductase I